MEFRVLGPIQVVAEGQPVDLGGTRERALLALLLLSANQVVSVDRLVDDLWGDRPPETAVPTLRVFVSRLRKALRQVAGDEIIVTEPPGYVARIDPSTLDVSRFQALAARGHAQITTGDAAGAATTLREALDLWRGPALGDLTETAGTRAAATRLEEERLAVLEERVEADLACGHHRQLIAELESLAAAHPLRERIWAHRMVALYRSGRQADALRAYQELRALLAEELGLEPSTALRELEGAILRQDPVLLEEAPPPGMPVKATQSPIRVGQLGPEPGSGPPWRRPPERLASPRWPLVGRQPELNRLRSALDQAATGSGRIVFVVGAMGIGKTRLVEEVLAVARRQQFIVLIGRTPAVGSGLAYAPFLSAFGAVLRSLEPAERNLLIGDLPHLGRLWPEFGLAPPSPVHDTDLERALLFEAVARLVERLTATSPTVFFVDDLHWSDAPSLALLNYLVPTIGELPIAMLGAYRPDGVSKNKSLRDFVTNARRSGLVSELPLAGLEPAEVAALTATVLGGAPPAALLELSDRAAGTPLFVEALVRGLLDSGELVRSDDGWTLAEDRPVTLPRNVHDLVVGRLDALDAEERSTVELLAHAAQGLPHPLLEHAGGLGCDELLTAVRRLVDGGLILQEDEGLEIVYRLSHPLIQEVAAAQLPAVASRRLHVHLAHAVETQRPWDLERMAYHYSRAGSEVDRDRAVEVLLDAAERAYGLAAHDEAARHLGTIIPLVRDGRRPELLAHLLERLGESLEPLGETGAAIEAWGDAVAERERVGDLRGVARIRRRLAFAAQAIGDITSARRHLDSGINALSELPPSDELVDLHAARLVIDAPFGEPHRARTALAELDRLAELVGSARSRTEALLAEASLTWVCGLSAESPRPKAEKALQIAEQAGEWALARRAHRELAWLAMIHGDHVAMEHHARAQVDIDRRLGDSAHASGPLLQLSYAALLAGRLEESSRLAGEAVAYARRYDQRRSLAMALGALALARIYRGDLEGAEQDLAEARQVFPQMLTDPRGGRALVAWPEAMLALERGDIAAVCEAARAVYPSIVRVLVATAQVLGGDLMGAGETASELTLGVPPGPYSEALRDRVLGLIAEARNERDLAREYLERSAASLAALDLPLEAAVSALHAGTVHSVRHALATFEACGAARYADRARRALRALGVRVASSRSGRDKQQLLSRRELEVARLVAEGLTSAEIADRLVLSVRTVESHLDHIYARLGISSRAALARWVTVSAKAGSSP